MERVSFAEAISDDKLFKRAFDDLSWPQRTVLKAFYGCDLSGAVLNPETGYSELDYWAIVQGNFEHDELGYVTSIIPTPYLAKEYEQLWAVIGRRSGKTSQLMAFIVAYEATLGGHEEYIQKNQECIVYLIAHRLDLAKANMPFVLSILDSSPLVGRQISNKTAEAIELKNGLKIVPSSPSLKAQRGFAIPVAAMDEVGFWYSDPESANPDFEVERAVSYSQAQFPFSKRIGISTPWTKEGLLWKYHKAGTDGYKLDIDDKSEYDGILTCFGTTASFENPLLTRKKFVRLRQADPEAFDRESLCKFLDSISGFFNSALINVAASKGKNVVERAPADVKDTIQPNYVAAIDPAFRHDSFAFCICHKSAVDGLVVDVLRQWTPIRGQKLNPKEILAELVPICVQYGVSTLYSDQYQLESLQQLALDQGMNIEGVDFTGRSKPQIYGNLNSLVNQQKLVLLDPDLSREAKTLVDEMLILEKRITMNGAVQISAPEGKHDDMVAVLALSSYKAQWLDATVNIQPEEYKEPSLFEQGMATIRKNNLGLLADFN